MSEHLLKLLLSELSIVRLVCRSSVCGAIVETTIDRLDQVFAAEQCPVCRAPFAITGEHHLIGLAKAIRGLAKMDDRFGVEFVVPQKPA